MKWINIIINKWYYYSFLLLLCIYVATNYTVGGIVEGYSMYPTLDSGTRVHLSKFFTYWHPIRRGDIVGINATKDGDPIRLVKRVIGIPGDHIMVKEGKVYINDVLINEPYIEEDTLTDGEIDRILAKEEYFVMGDNRNDSIDSRSDQIKPIMYKDIIGVLIEVEGN